MRTLSARILLGFAALTVAFGVITATVVVNMTIVEAEIREVRQGRMPLAFASKDLARREEDLNSYLDKEFAQQPNADSANISLRTVRERRNSALIALRKSFDDLVALTKADPATFTVLAGQVDDLKIHYDHLLVALRKGDPMDGPSITDPLRQLREGESRINQLTTDLANQLKRRVDLKAENLEDNEHKLRFWTIALGCVAIGLGLMMTIWVLVTLRPLRRLRDAARRVAAGDYASRIPEKGPAEVADLARELNSMARAVEERERELVRSERLAAVGKLARMITHEVRNPLSSIGLNAELLDDELADNEEARALCRAIHHEVDRLTAITEEYLAFGKLPKPKIASQHVNAMVEALGSFVRADLAAKQVELVIDLDPHDPIGLVDASQLRQCLVNLVRNATEAVSSKGGGTVTLRTRKAGDRVVIEVEDTGIGIAPDVLPRLFDTFFSTKEGGSGLGLALTQQIVKDHGGELSVESQVGRGTTFTLSIPRG